MASGGKYLHFILLHFILFYLIIHLCHTFSERTPWTNGAERTQAQHPDLPAQVTRSCCRDTSFASSAALRGSGRAFGLPGTALLGIQVVSTEQFLWVSAGPRTAISVNRPHTPVRVQWSGVALPFLCLTAGVGPSFCFESKDTGQEVQTCLYN